MIPFFMFHYGMLWVVHGVFVIVFFGILGGRFFTDSSGPDIGGFSGFEPRGVAIASAALFLSRGVSFVVNFLGEREYLNVSPDKQMMEPYSRVVVLHATILGGVPRRLPGDPAGLARAHTQDGPGSPRPPEGAQDSAATTAS